MAKKDHIGMSSIEIGDDFEAAVSAVLAITPGAEVRRRQSIGGKSVDVVLVTRSTLSAPSRTIAVECKNYERRLTRAQVASILSDYSILVDNRQINAVYIVTRKGIVDNAAQALNGETTRHFTFDELLGNVIDLNPLLQDMRIIFEQDGLQHYYETTYCEPVNFKLAEPGLSDYFHPFINYLIRDAANSLDYRITRATLVDRSYQHPRFDFDPSVIVNEIETISDVQIEAEWSKWRSGFSDDASLIMPSTARIRQILLDRLTPKRSKKMKVDSVVDEWLQSESKIQLALLGGYGTGKSTYSRALAWRLARDHIAGKQARIPLRIELRHLTAAQDVEALITHQLVDVHRVEGANFIRFQSLNAAGLFVLILDGFDEMKEGMTRENLIHNFNEINKLAVGKSKILLCGRPTAFRDNLEQRAVLQGVQSPLENEVEYLPLDICLLSTKRVVPLVTKYAKSLGPSAEAQLSRKMDELSKALKNSPYFRDLMSRPVHIPMLLKILPTLNQEIGELSRTTLYSQFVTKTIEREEAKVRPANRTFSVEERLDFARRLAFEMASLGDSRSINISSVPPELFERFRRGSRSLDAVKRDLVGACFLEFKPPDILVFGHKSYCEFLVADFIATRLRSQPDTDSMDITYTHEILSFLVELIGEDDFRLIGENFLKHVVLGNKLFLFLRTFGDAEWAVKMGQAFTKNIAWAKLLKDVQALPPQLMSRVVDVCEAMRPSDKTDPAIVAGLLGIAAQDRNYIAVHALRALPPADKLSYEELSALIGAVATEYWTSRGWIDHRIVRDAEYQPELDPDVLLIRQSAKLRSTEPPISGNFRPIL
ncbi:NACHT domain-containing protein [Mycolicibacterium aichiense]|uniref:NACHT domain-containing protein n=1 Tax=Mycolicibacterium aichiense TaxID=1799 RepID=UPI003D679D85